ncbi:MAG: hypothetical protein JWM80_4827 [Cyanobacteria bacterium RYN_339]|nr:hypothetical protein [Cyanobacteria bacterium RYN_339]
MSKAIAGTRSNDSSTMSRAFRLKEACDNAAAPCSKFSRDQYVAAVDQLGPTASDDLLDRTTQMSRREHRSGLGSQAAWVGVGVAALAGAGGVMYSIGSSFVESAGWVTVAAIPVFVGLWLLASNLKKRANHLHGQRHDLLSTFG